jgi:hypothetical protein
MDLGEASRRALHRLALFPDAIPADAVVTLAALDRRELAKLIRAGALVPSGSGFRVAPEARALAAALPPSTDEAKGDATRHAEWLLHTIASTEAAHDTRVTFDLVEPLLGDVKIALRRLAEYARLDQDVAALAARLWCAIADVLFYRRSLPFDAPEYAASIEWADRTTDARLRVATRIFAGRAAMEVTPADAKGHFDSARELAERAALTDLGADATRGLGWFVLANGDLASARAMFDEARAVHEEVRNTRGIADACMAQAVASALSGDLAATDQLFFRAEAILRARRDGVRLDKLGNLRVMFGGGGQPWADVTVADWLSRGQYWRAALSLAHREDAPARDRARILADLAGVAWEKLVAMRAEEPGANAPPTPETSRWILRVDGVRRLLVSPDGRELDITRRGPLVKMLDALGRAKKPVGPIDLFEAAWPGESVRHESALYRVYTTVRRLRALGLPIATTADGYFCEPLTTEH